MNKWREQLESLDALFKEFKHNREKAGRLRFGRSVMAASDIAEQFYCEKKLEMKYFHGKVETARANSGCPFAFSKNDCVVAYYLEVEFWSARNKGVWMRYPCPKLNEAVLHVGFFADSFQ
jgi:hypothetical protein